MNGKCLKTIGKELLKDLVDRNLILVDELGSTGNIKSVKIHDLLRDLCLNLGQRDGFYHVIGQSSPRGIHSQRRIVIPRNTSEKKVLDDLQYMSRARSIICEYGKVPQCSNYGLLRTIHAYKFRTYEDESYVNSLVSRCVNLRHLAVEVGSMSSIFSSFNHLWNLHTLIVSSRYNSTFNVPTEIWKMPQLRHIEMAERILCLPNPLNDAVVMQNLVVLEGAHNFKCDDEVVKRILNIKKLGILYSGREGIDHDDYYCLSNIKSLCKLESLDICNESDASLHKLSFPETLKSLTLDMKGDFEWEGMLEKIGALPLLEKFILWRGCFGKGKWEMVEGQFPCLKYLGLHSCPSLEHWTAEASSVVFPRLEKLYLSQLEELKEIPFQIGDISTLQNIWLFDSSESAAMCVKEIVEEQVELQGEDLPFHVQVWLMRKDEAVQSLTGPNFEVNVIFPPSRLTWPNSFRNGYFVE
ncbi:putative late blight resistance protein homolog R1A-3 [Salvia miltiorrhiza]|uniref:putative late blight resistance protein homolog R1A-3 n=1 Tax=Salvia miltiorrhiza TaxID=226208 RepID=UPI0025AB84DF|nr:putative late blight resistance protein homolog R1A-3 [Salvia miltiorrhiza]